jgi:Flp pilus assembly protein TadD
MPWHGFCTPSSYPLEYTLWNEEPSTLDINRFVQQGNDLLGIGNLAAANACFDAALQLDPTNAEAHFGRGLASYQLGDNATAVAAFTACIQLQPDIPGVAAAYAMRCMARSNLNDRRGAMSDYREAVSRDSRMHEYFQSQTCVGTAQVFVLAQAYPAQFAMLVELLTRA